MKTHRSSSTTFFYKYLFAPICGGILLIGIISTPVMKDLFIRNWSIVTVLIVCWALISQITLMIRLKSVEANEEYLIIKTFKGVKLISYKEIEYVSQMAMTGPALISIKYYDQEAGESRNILVIPVTSNHVFRLNPGQELEMTKFLRRQVIKANPYYNPNNEPSRWLPFVMIMLSGIILGLPQMF